MVEIKILVPDEKWSDVFFGWYLDGGGESDFLFSLDDQEVAKEGTVDVDWDEAAKTITHTRRA